ncbi:hypothetical protein PAHAL_8G231800 [Panicum hallii]|uniref:Uncharacterized protein n=1 Tax=Panicum hallii TaxID=206008 RepID=A0A2T8IA01_9POAL|nr:hypothetical protein PAHAL_8G231800 [Panicum hallii]
MRELAVRDRRLNEGAMGRGVGQWVQVWCLPAILLPSRFLAFLSPKIRPQIAARRAGHGPCYCYGLNGWDSGLSGSDTSIISLLES